MKALSYMSLHEEEKSALSPNALQVLERRYLARDEEGGIIETPEERFTNPTFAIR